MTLGAAFPLAFNWSQVWREIRTYKFRTENVHVQTSLYFIFPLENIEEFKASNSNVPLLYSAKMVKVLQINGYY